MKTFIKHLPFILIILILVVGALYFFNRGEEDESLKGLQGTTYTTTYTFLNATSTTATSTNTTDGDYLSLVGAKSATILFQREGVNGNEGSSQFYLQVTQDGDNWYNYARLNTSTSTAITGTRYVTLNGTTTQLYTMNFDDDVFLGVRAIINETTDGEHTVSARVEY